MQMPVDYQADNFFSLKQEFQQQPLLVKFLLWGKRSSSLFFTSFLDYLILLEDGATTLGQ